MKKVLIILAACATAASPVFASTKVKVVTGHQLQSNFGMALESGRSGQILEMFNVQLRAKIDQAVLQRLVDQAKSKLGRIKSLKQTEVSSVQKNGKHSLETTAVLTCEKGVATVSLRAVNSKIVGFDLQSKQLINWLDKPATTKPYEDLATTFVREMLTGDAQKAFRLMHPALQEQLGPEDYETLCKSTRGTVDASKRMTVKVRSSRMVEPKENRPPTMLINLGLQNGDKPGACEVKIQFFAMRGHLMGFHFNK